MGSKFLLYTTYSHGAFFFSLMFFAIFIPFLLLLDFVSEFEKVQPTCDWKQ